MFHIHYNQIKVKPKLKTLSSNPFTHSKIPSRKSHNKSSRISETLSFKPFTHRKIPSLTSPLSRTLFTRPRKTPSLKSQFGQTLFTRQRKIPSLRS
jgi:hypothetical protein